MDVIKFSGEIQSFKPNKIYATIREAGGTEKIARETIRKIERKKKKIMHSGEILSIVLKNLKKEAGVSQRYNLKRSIMELGPAGFTFEKYFSQILRNYGYETQTNQKLRGKKIFHEVDIVTKREKKYLIECKYHNDPGKSTRLHSAMYTYARVLDLKKYKFDSSWLVTNTKCSQDAVNYSIGVNQKVTSWNHPKKESLRELIQKENLFPVTILQSIRQSVKRKLIDKEILIIKEILLMKEKELLKYMSRRNVRKMLVEIAEVINPKLI